MLVRGSKSIIQKSGRLVTAISGFFEHAAADALML
jgi:hypothetical protein